MKEKGFYQNLIFFIYFEYIRYLEYNCIWDYFKDTSHYCFEPLGDEVYEKKEDSVDYYFCCCMCVYEFRREVLCNMA